MKWKKLPTEHFHYKHFNAFTCSCVIKGNSYENYAVRSHLLCRLKITIEIRNQNQKKNLRHITEKAAEKKSPIANKSTRKKKFLSVQYFFFKKHIKYGYFGIEICMLFICSRYICLKCIWLLTKKCRLKHGHKSKKKTYNETKLEWHEIFHRNSNSMKKDHKTYREKKWINRRWWIINEQEIVLCQTHS